MQSTNAVNLKDLLRRALGLETGSPDNGLGRFAGTWTADDLVEIERNTRMFETVDPELWK